MLYRIFLGIFFLFVSLLQAIEVETEELPTTTPYVPWFTGPLLAPSGNVVPLGSINVEPYFYIIAYTGTYTPQWSSHGNPIFWSYLLSVPIEFGIAPRVDITITPNALYNKTQGKHSWGIGDTSVSLAVQLVAESTSIPSVKFGFQETFPTGGYTSLDPVNFFTDGTGTGSYVSTPALIVSKLIPISDTHYLNCRGTVAIDIPTSVSLHGLSVYGGTPVTKGIFYPSSVLNINIGLEYNFSRNWAGALDILYTYATPSTFQGKNGQFLFSTLDGILDTPSSIFSLAPALEYNWSESIGLIAGCWFAIAGSNSFVFRNGIIAFNYYK